MSSFDRLIVHTNRARQRLIDHGLPTAKIAIIPHGVLESDAAPLASRAKSTASEPVTLLLFGKIKPYKGTDVLIRALAAMPASFARTSSRIVGKPYMDMAPLFALARELGVEVEHHLGFAVRRRRRIEADLRRSRCYRHALPGDRCLRRAHARIVDWPSHCRPSRIGLFAEVLDDGEHGRLVTPDQPDELAEALTALVDSSAERVRMSCNVRALRDSIPDWQTIGAQTAALYDVALGEFTGAQSAI